MKNYALISVSNKEGLGTIARALISEGFELLATGGTKNALEKEGFLVTEVSALTNEPERFSGRLKTLHHMILGAILLRPGKDEAEWPFGYRIGAVVCNFYPFAEKSKQSQGWPELMEWVDIGGPTMVRAAAKNFAHVLIFTNPDQYVRYVATPQERREDLRLRLAYDAFELVSHLDSMIVDEFQLRICQQNGIGLEKSELRYGENPHQKAYFTPNPKSGLRMHGELSFNNLRDAEAAYRYISPFSVPAASIVKHQTLCGAAVGHTKADLTRLFHYAWEGDAVSRFGGVVACNFIPSETTTKEIFEKKFLELVVIPRKGDESSEWARQVISVKPKLRVVEVDLKSTHLQEGRSEVYEGLFGTLRQDRDTPDPRLVEEAASNFAKLEILSGTWAAACSKSNAIVLMGTSKQDEIVFLAGTGQGQPNRVEALKSLALERAQDFCKRMQWKLSELICFSDGFLPFTDTLQVLHEAGIRRLVQPGGSKADADVIAEANRLGIEMLMTGRRHFWH